MMLQRYLRILLLFFSLFLTSGYAATCAAPTDTLSVGVELKKQELSHPFIDGDPASGEALYYEMNIPADGTLTISTDIESDSVDTYGYLRDSSCNLIATASVYKLDPRSVSLDILLSAGTYYFQVENNVTTADAVKSTDFGEFKIKSSFAATHPPREITISKTSASSVDSGKSLTYKINVTNTGSEDTTSVVVTDTMPVDFAYQSFSNSADWNCTQSGLDISCTLLSGVISANGGSKSLFLTAQADYLASDTVTDNVAKADVGYSSGSLTVSDNKAVTIYKAVPGITMRKTAVKTGTNTAITEILKDADFEYILKVTNNSKLIDSNVTITDTLPADFNITSLSFVATDWDCQSSGQDMACYLKSDLAVGASAEMRIAAKAIGAVSNGIINSATVNADTVMGANTATDSDTASLDIVGESYSATFTKSNPDTTIVVGDNTTYTITVTNSSNVPLSSIQIVDTLPADLNVSAINALGWTCQPIVSNKVDCSLDSNLSVGASASIDVVALALSSGTGIMNTATLSTLEMADKNASESIDILATAPSNLTITKSSSQDTVIENDIFSYIISVTNSGAGSEDNLIMTDTIPAEFIVDGNISSGSWNCSLSGNSVSCTLASLASGATADDITITVTAPSNIPVDKTVSNIAKIVSDKETTGITAQKDVNLVSPSTAISVHLKSHPTTVYQGESYSYELFISNNSAKTTETARVSSILPVDVVFDYVDSGGWVCDYNATSREVSCDTNGTKLLTGDKEIDIHVLAPNYETNVTTTMAVTTDLDPYVREGNVTTVVLGKKPKLIFTQSDASKDPVDTNETFTYGIKVQNVNTGNVINNITAKNVKVLIDLDANLHYIDHNTSSWDCNVSGSSLSCLLLSDLAVGAESPPISIDVMSPVPAFTITDLNLTSDLTQTEVLTDIPVDVYDEINANLTLTLSDDIDPVEADTNFSYLLNVGNSGSSSDANELDVTIETLSSDNFILNGYVGIGWNCSQSGKFVYCHLDTLAANSNSALELNVKAPDINNTLQINATLDSNVVNENDISDNSASETTLVIQYDYDSDNLRDFTQVLINGNTNTNIYGEVFAIGNQVICEKDGSGKCQEPSFYVNDWVYQEQANLDPLISTYDSSTSATLDITADDEVIWAGLYWMGMIDRNAGDTSKIEEAKHVYLRHDSDTSYHKVQSSPLKLNWKNDTSFGVNMFGYQGMADVTDYVKAHKDGDYWVANVQTTEGYNLSAGWNLVVVVQDKTMTRKLRNITLFDGFQSVWKNTAYVEANAYPDFVKATVSGFLTPNSGAVSSKLTLFGLEGDATLKDSIAVTDENNVSQFLTNVLNPSDDVVNGTISYDGISNIDRTPALLNSSGIDIDTFDISSIIGNGQSSTDITIASQGDRFYLGMFGFSTELYLPKMCYVETMANADFTPLTNNREFNLGDSIGFEIYIQNDEHETARNILLKSEIDVIYRETNTTAQIKNVGEGSFTDHTELWDTYEINSTNDANESVPQTIFNARIGSGADSSAGGDMSYSDRAYFRYHGIVDGIPDGNNTQNVYKISYKIDNMAEVAETTISACYDFNQSIFVKPNHTTGFDVTHEGGLSDGMDDNSTNENHLFTQLSDTNFNVDIVSLENDFATTRVNKGVIRLDLIDVNSTECISNPTLSSRYVSFNDLDRVTETLSSSIVGQNVAFRVHYPINRYKTYATWLGLDVHNLVDLTEMLKASYGSDYPCKSECSTLSSCQECIYNPINNVSRVSCSRDTFAIRPKDVSMDSNATLVGGRDYALLLDANASGYNPTFPVNVPQMSIRRELIKPVSCGVADVNETILTSNLTFIDGNATVTDFHYNNVGNMDVTFLDTLWTSTDQNSTDSMMSDCVVGSSSNTLVGGKYGCDLQAMESFVFIPSHFESQVDFQNDQNGSFTYLDSNGIQRARAFMTISALLYDNTTASNYTSGCFAKDIGYNFSAFASNNVYEDQNAHYNSGFNIFETGEGNFTNGVAKPVLGINFARVKTEARNPFDVNSSTFDINVTDGDVVGSGFAVKNGMARYYYARLYAPDYLSIESAVFKAPLYYEVYCDEDAGCDKNSMGLSGLFESRDHVNWYIFNDNHDKTVFGDYDASSVTSSNGLTIGAKAVKSIELKLMTLKRPHCDRITLKPDAWFKYDEYSPSQAENVFFKACFVSNGSWVGTGEVGMVIDANISRKKNTKIDW